MSKLDLIMRVKSQFDTTDLRATEIVKVVLDEIMKEVREKGEFRITDFGTFKILHQDRKHCILPDGRHHVSAEKNKVKFIAHKGFLRGEDNEAVL